MELPMAIRHTPSENGDISLAAAVSILIQSQARFVSHLDEDRRRFNRIEKRLANIEAVLSRHTQILERHEQILQDLRKQYGKSASNSRRDYFFKPAVQLRTTVMLERALGVTRPERFNRNRWPSFVTS
jgi:hypothetical protein